MLKEPEKPAEIAVAIPALRRHLAELTESPAFKGSKRGQQFLHHIVEKTLTGCWEDLKERSLGVELFGRDPSYDTGEDAIVRVTASDVRKRLQHYYAERSSAVRIEIPAGAYTPQFHFRPELDVDLPAPALTAKRRDWRRAAALTGTLIVLAAALSGWFWQQRQNRLSQSPVHALPWSALLADRHQVQLIFSDPDVTAMQELTGAPVTLSDYANRRYLTNVEALSSERQQALRHLRGTNVAAVDAGIAVALSALTAQSPGRLKTATARSLQLSTFKSDDDFILLGSPRSNPWSALFEDQLDFEFVRDPKLNDEFIRNKRVLAGELARYTPTARGWGTGHGFATIALVANPNQAGKVLLLAGTNAEGTEAAGQFVTNHAQLASTLRNHGIDPRGAACYFQILLQVRTMAGSPSKAEVVACHRLPGTAAPAR